MPDPARDTESTCPATPVVKRELALQGECWTVTETSMPAPGHETLYLISFTAPSNRQLNVTLPRSFVKLTDAELADIWLRCLLWEQDA